MYRVQKKLICSKYKGDQESLENQSAFSRFLNWCRLPFIHPSLIQDYLKHFEELNEKEKAELAEIFDECLKSDIEVVNKKDPIYGQTAMHVAFNSCMFEELSKMAEAGADFTIKNKYGKRSQDLVNEKLTSCKEDDEEEKAKLLTLKETIISKQEQIRQLSNQTESSDGSMQMKQSSNDGTMQRFST